MSRTTRRLLIALVALALVVPVAALASDRFTDVPNSNIFHDDITWLADAAVTLGCNPPANDEFCPTDNVTRQQMAAFMKRLAENQVVDAGLLQGRAADELVRVAAVSTFENVDGWDGTEIEDTVTVEAPSNGFIVILYTVNLGKDNGGGGTGDQLFTLEPRLDDTLLGDFEDVFSLDYDDAGSDDTTESLQRVITVDPGTYDVSVAVAQGGAPTTDLTFIYDRSLTALFVPFDGAGAIPVPLDPTGSSGSNND